MAAQQTHPSVPMPPTTGTNSAARGSASPWYRFISNWAVLTAVIDLGLVLLFVTVVLPTGSGALPAEYLELVAAGRKPVLYRMTIALDIASWLMLGGLLVAFAALLVRVALIRSTFIAVLGVGAFVGFLGACLRLVGTADLGARYLSPAAHEHSAVLASYVDQERLVNVSFSAGGMVLGIAFVLVASVAWRMAEFPRAGTILFALGGLLGFTKGALELATGADLGLLALLHGIMLIGGMFTIAVRFHKLPRTG